MADDVRRLIAAHKTRDAGSLRALAIALAATVVDPPPLPTDPVELYAAVEERPAVAAGTWQEVVAARDDGRLTVAEYAYLAAAVDALTELEDEE